jgi:predicted nucleic acid-binding protein
MKDFLDASVIVELATVFNSDKFEVADALVQSGAYTSTHALAEAYATLSGDKRLKINPHDAAEILLNCASKLQTASLSESESMALIKNAPSRGITEGSFYDAIHAETDRKMGCSKIHTLNENHLRHVAPDLEIAPL